MDWYDVEDVIADGTKQEVDKLVCPECNSKLKIKYYDTTNNLDISCTKCGVIEKLYKFPTPRYLMAVN